MRKKAFTLIELLVVISIIALLLSIVAPGLRAAKESARRTICATHLKGIGQGVFVYANSNQQRLPESLYTTGCGSPSASYMMFYLKQSGISPATPPKQRYDKVYGFGLLFTSDIIGAAETFYCPSTPQPTEATGALSVSYRYAQYSNNGTTFPWNNDWGNTAAWNWHCVRSSYNYLPQASIEKGTATSPFGLGSGKFPKMAKKVSDLNSTSVMAFDYLFHYDFLPHKRGGGKNASGVNALVSDGSVSFANNHEAFDAQLWGSVPTRVGNDEYLFRKIVNMLK